MSLFKERAPIFIELARSLSVCGVGRADTVARTPVSVMTRKPELSVLFPKRKRAIRIAGAISGNDYYANSEGGCGYDRSW